DISEPIVGGDNEKNTQSDEQSSITKSDDISAVLEPSKNISRYFLCGKNMDQAGKIDTIIPDHTDDKSTSIPEESVIQGYASSPKVDAEITPKVSDEIDINKNSNNIPQEIPKVTPYLAQPENYSGDSVKTHTPSLLESHPQISIGGVGTIPIVADAVASSLRERKVSGYGICGSSDNEEKIEVK
ncbi:6399_t:CDS:2, partial [Entrophospora sp. SA101]